MKPDPRIYNHNSACADVLRKIEDVWHAIPNRDIPAYQVTRGVLEGMMVGATMLRDQIQRDKDRETSEAKCER